MNAPNEQWLPAGTALQNYRIERVLGQGGFGITYLALDTALNRKVAIKEYFPFGYALRVPQSMNIEAANEGAREVFEWGRMRFLDEGRTLAGLSHPNIVGVHYFMELHNTAYIIMAFEEGQPLSSWLETFEGSRPPQSAIAPIVEALSDALRVVHEVGIAHRDIKPDNILVRPDGSPVLIDFGAARNVFGGRSKVNTAIVTAGYSPPEQYGTETEQGPWSDIYALGAVLYHVISGTEPKDAPSRTLNELSGTPDPSPLLADQQFSGYDQQFLQAVDWAFNLRMENRPQNIEAWRKAFGFANRTRPSFENTGSGNANALTPRQTAPTIMSPDKGAPTQQVDFTPHTPNARQKSKKPLVIGAIALSLAATIAGIFVWLPESIFTTPPTGNDLSVLVPKTPLTPPPAKTEALLKTRASSSSLTKQKPETKPNLRPTPDPKPRPKSINLFFAAAGAARTGGELSEIEAHQAAKTLARAKVIRAARGTPGGLPNNIVRMAQASDLTKSLDTGIPFDEKWRESTDNSGAYSVTLKAKVRQLSDRAGLSARLSKPNYAAMEPIHINLSVLQDSYVGLFAWQADGSVLRINPKGHYNGLKLSAGQKVKLPQSSAVTIISAPLAGAAQSHEAIVVLACAQPADYTALAPSAADVQNTAGSGAIDSSLFLQRLAKTCPRQLTVRILNYIVRK